MPQTLAIAAGAGLIAVLSYRLMLPLIAGVMTLAAVYVGTRRAQWRVVRAEVPEPTAAAT